MIRRAQHLATAHRLVIKIGTGVLIDPENRINLKLMESLTSELARLCRSGREVILVSSGAIAFGMLHLGLGERPREISQKQACAAIGQSHLVHHYEQFFARAAIKVGQVLLSRDDLENSRRYENAKRTFEQLLAWKILPIVNENDSVAIEELKIGDNDNLSALVAVATDAHLLVILSHVDGVFSADPRQNPAAVLIPELEHSELDGLTGVSAAANSELNTGGMMTKMQAARVCAKAGIATAIVNGCVPETIHRLLAGEAVGTIIYP